MLLRTKHDLGQLIQDARRTLGWSQSQLAATIGVSRQWVSLVENGKTSVEFDLVFSLLKALGYLINLEPATNPNVDSRAANTPSHRASGRTSLTQGGQRLTPDRSTRTVRKESPRR